MKLKIDGRDVEMTPQAAGTALAAGTLDMATLMSAKVDKAEWAETLAAYQTAINEAAAAKVSEAEAKLAAATAPKAPRGPLTFDVSTSSSGRKLSCYFTDRARLGRFPVQLHRDQWQVLIDNFDTIRAEFEAHRENLDDLGPYLAARISGGKSAKA